MVIRRQAGFTLLEMMVSVTIIAIALVTLIGSQSQSVSIATISRFETIASLLAREKMTELALGGFENLSSEDGDFGEDFPEYYWQVEVTDLGEEDTGIAEASDMLRAVDLIISFGADSDETFAIREIMMAPIKN